MIGSVSSGSSYVSQLVSSLYSKLDSNDKGYFQLSDLESALGTSSSSSSGDASSSAAEDLFGQLDGDSDGKVTQSELSSGLQQLASALNGAYDQMRMGGASSGDTPPPPPPDGAQGNGMPPPPPPGDSGSDAGFTKDELQSQLDSLGSTDSKRSSLISSIIQNFDKADSNGDGTVSASEAMAYDQANSVSSTTATASGSSDSSSSDTASSSDSSNVMGMIMQLLRAYGQNDNSQSGVFSASA